MDTSEGCDSQRTTAPAELTAALLLALSPARSLTPPLASILLIGNFSGALPAPLCALSTRVLVVACDYRECEWASPPANFVFHRGCGRRLAVSQEWDLVIGSTDCTSIAKCDTNAASRAKKLADGTAWWNAMLPVWILCLRNAKRAAVELPRSLLDVWLVWPAETSVTNLWWYGSPWSKTTIWRTRGLRLLVPSSAALTPPAGGFPSLSHTVFDHDDDERRRKRSTYDTTYAAGVVSGWDLLTTFEGSSAAGDAPPFDELRDAVAAEYVAYGGTLPAGWQSQWAMPPGGDVSAGLLTASAPRRSGRKRNAPPSYAARDENDELPGDAKHTGPVLDWSWLPVPVSPRASAREWISFDLPKRRQPLRSSLPVKAIFKLCGGERSRTYVPWLLTSESGRLPGQYAMYSLRQDTFAPPKKGAKGLQHARIGQLRGKPMGLFSSEQQLGIAGDELRRATGNHYLFSLQEGGGWRLLDGDVNELPLLKYANDVHGSGDMANAALMQFDSGSRCAGMMVALERIRVLDEIRWAYGWSTNMWREVLNGAQPLHVPTAPASPESMNALLNSAGTPEDLQELLEDEGSSSHEQPLAAADNERVTRVATIEDLITCGRQLGKLQLHKPGDLRITRPHAAGNPFTKRLACTSGDCHSRNSFDSRCDA